eukprot:g13602.t1
MAKSIRSKVKKRNRTEMRKTVGDPHQQKLQARCTAKIQKSVAFSAGESVTKLKRMLTAAQAANPPTKEVSKNGFAFRHPDAPPPIDDDDATPPSPSPARRARGRTPRGRARSLSDAEASMIDEEMGDVGDDSGDGASAGAAAGGSPAGRADGLSGGGGGVGSRGGERGRNTASELAAKMKKKRRQAKRRNYVEFPAPEN